VIYRTQSVSLRIRCPQEDTPTHIQNLLWKKFRSRLDDITRNSCSKEILGKLEECLTLYKTHASIKSNLFLDRFISDLHNRSLAEINRKYFPLNLPDTQSVLPCWIDINKLFLHTIIPCLEAERKQVENYLNNETLPIPIIRDRLLKLLVADFENKQPTFRGYVLAIDEFADFLSLLQSTDFNKIPERLFLFVRCEVHYTTVVLEKEHSHLNAYVLDAAGDPRGLALSNELRCLNIGRIYVVGKFDKIQFDTYNCAFFSFELAKTFHKTNGIKNLNKIDAKQMDCVHYLHWSDLPEEFIQFTTSRSFIQKYLQNHPERHNKPYKKEITFKEYIESHQGSIDESGRKGHNRIVQKVEKYKQMITRKILQSETNELDEITNRLDLLKL
jgi:hypothetical protein